MIIRPASFASSLDVLHNIILPLHNRVNAGWSISRPRKKKKKVLRTRYTPFYKYLRVPFSPAPNKLCGVLFSIQSL